MKNNLNKKEQEVIVAAVDLNDFEKFLKETQRKLNQKRQPDQHLYNEAINVGVAACKNGKLKKPDDMGYKKAVKATIEGLIRKADQVQKDCKTTHEEGTYSVEIFCKNIEEINKLERRLKKLQEFTDYLVSLFERNSKITISQAGLIFYITLLLSKVKEKKKELIA